MQDPSRAPVAFQREFFFDPAWRQRLMGKAFVVVGINMRSDAKTSQKKKNFPRQEWFT